MEAFFYFSRLSGNPSVLIGSPRPPLASVSIDPASGALGDAEPDVVQLRTTSASVHAAAWSGT